MICILTAKTKSIVLSLLLVWGFLVTCEKESKHKYLLLFQSTGGGHTNLVKQTDEYKATFPGMNESDAAKVSLHLLE